MKRMLLPLLLLGATASVGLAQDRFELTGSSRGVDLEAQLSLEESGETHLSIPGRDGLLLAGTLERKGSHWVGTLRSNRGRTDALTPGARSDRWNAKLLRQGPVVSLRLASGMRSVELEGIAELGAADARNEAVIRRFYEAFTRKDADTMAACYAADVHFSDPVFPNLYGADAGDMWRMLCESDDLVVEFSDVRADGRFGYAHWEAHYELFGNRIHNVIEARFEFRDGEIVRHVDQFDFKRWSSMAFTKAIRLLPSVAVRHVVRRITASQLKTFQEDKAAAKAAAKSAPTPEGEGAAQQVQRAQ